ncbi:hypothetical protein IWX49DRAFT_74154 [Phyllosticta citricarpa]
MMSCHRRTTCDALGSSGSLSLVLSLESTLCLVRVVRVAKLGLAASFTDDLKAAGTVRALWQHLLGLACFQVPSLAAVHKELIVCINDLALGQSVRRCKNPFAVLVGTGGLLRQGKVGFELLMVVAGDADPFAVLRALSRSRSLFCYKSHRIPHRLGSPHPACLVSA